MKKSVADKWVKALRSGQYPKGECVLNRKGNYCCLGVLCEINNIKKTESYGIYHYDGCESYFTENLMKKLGIKSSAGTIPGTGKALSDLNDSGEYTFDEIADIIQICYKEL